MKLFSVAVMLALGCVAGLVVGIVSGQTWLVAVAFCSWTPVMLMLGYSIRAAGVRVVAAGEYHPEPAPQRLSSNDDVRSERNKIKRLMRQ